jgi:hypothetical protein
MFGVITAIPKVAAKKPYRAKAGTVNADQSADGIELSKTMIDESVNPTIDKMICAQRRTIGFCTTTLGVIDDGIIFLL